MDIGVVAIGDFAAIDALIAAIDGDAVFATDGLEAIQRFGERLGDGFEFAQFVAGKKIGVREPSAFERALQQFDALRLIRELFE